MDATTVGIDLAKNVFEIALADERGHIVERQRLSRARFDRFFANRSACRIVMEACGSAHHHARRLSSQGHSVVLLPAQYARAYVRRNKTDAADAAALIEAARCPDIHPVPIKSVDQQALQQLHRLRSQWMATRTSRINFLRGCLREFGISIPVGAQRAIQSVRDALSDPHTARCPTFCIRACSNFSQRSTPSRSAARRSSASSRASTNTIPSSSGCCRSPVSGLSPPPRCVPRWSTSSAFRPAGTSPAGSASLRASTLPASVDVSDVSASRAIRT